MYERDWPLLILPTMVMVAPVYAADYLTVADAQRVLFPSADEFIPHPVSLSDEQKTQIKLLSGVRQRWDQQQVWRANGQGALLGWFIVDNVVGKHEFITYATALSPAGAVLGIEIMSYRETHGGEVREATWRDHFRGKTLADPFRLDEDIPNLSGATLSSRNLTDGVKRLLALQRVALPSD